MARCAGILALCCMLGAATACTGGQPALADRSSPGEDQATEARADQPLIEAGARDTAQDRSGARELPTQGGPLRVMTLNLHCLQELPDVRAKGIALQIHKLAP